MVISVVILLITLIITTHEPPSRGLRLPYRILNINHKKELLRGLWVTLV